MEILHNFEIIKKQYSVPNTVLFFGNGNKQFNEQIAEHFKCVKSATLPERFSDGEIKIPQINENCRQKNCVIVQSCSYNSKYSVNDLLMEVFILIDTVKRANAKTITVVFPIYPYQRQDRKSYSRSPISASMIATILEGLGIDRLICFELHASQIQGFFHKVPVDNLTMNNYFKECINNIVYDNNINKDDIIIVSPDEGGVKRASKLAKQIKCSMALLHKERVNSNEVDSMVLMGNVSGKCCIIVDDMIDTAGTVMKACNVLKMNGANTIYVIACHGILSGPAFDRINECNECNAVYVSNTVDVLSRLEYYDETGNINYKSNKVKVFDVSDLCAAAIYKGICGESVSEIL